MNDESQRSLAAQAIDAGFHLAPDRVTDLENRVKALEAALEELRREFESHTYTDPWGRGHP